MLKRIIVSYLCAVISLGSSLAQAAVGDAGSNTKPPPSFLDDAGDYANDFSGEEPGMSPFTPQTPLSRQSALSVPRLSTKEENTGVAARGSEYISGYYRGAVLMPVRLWGAVRQTGLHQIPTGTDLMQLITLAGGPNADAELDKVTVKRTGKNGYEVIKVDLREMINSPEQAVLELQPNDIVILPAVKPFISTNTLTTISVITSVVGIVASSLLIANQIK